MSVETAVEVISDSELLLQLRHLFIDSKLVGIDGGIKAYIFPRADAHKVRFLNKTVYKHLGAIGKRNKCVNESNRFGCPASLSRSRLSFLRRASLLCVDVGNKSLTQMSEYLADSDQHLKFISGFTGSNAFAVITDEHSLLWTDSRYFDQAGKELHEEWTMMKQGLPESIDPIDWICQNLPSGSTIGFTPHLFSISDAKSLLSKTASVGINVVSIKRNLVDILWRNQPAPIIHKLISLSAEECGEDIVTKVERVRGKLREHKCDTIILTLLDDVAWLLNIRGFDIPYNPVVFSIVILNFNDVFLFVDDRKISPDVQQHLSGVKIYPYKQAIDFLEQYHKQFREQCPTHRIWIPNDTNYALASAVDIRYMMIEPSPVQLMKAQKNEVELKGIRNAGIRDSSAHIQFLLWMSREIELGHHVTEDRAAKQMDYYRSQLEGFISPSFETISAVGKHAALPHYTHTAESSRLLLPDLVKINDDSDKQETTLLTEADKPIESNVKSIDSVYLIDSGGHFRDGTTDVTRTIHVGQAPADELLRRMFTLVLKCHIDLASLIFPSGTPGIRLDAIARQAQWRYGYDFGHSIGHGVGHFLNVHEYPPFIGYRVPEKVNVPILQSMVHTIEPGYYEKGQFGIRIENSYETVAVSPDELPSRANNFLKYTPLTFIPVQKNLIVPELMDSNQVQWLNAYHNRCLEVVGKYLQERGLQEEYNFLAEACTPL